MAIFAVGPLVEGATPAQIEARQIRVAGLASRVQQPSGQFRIDVTAAVGAAEPQSFVGRRFQRSNGALITVAAETKATRLADWTRRAAIIFHDGMSHKQFWWPNVYSATGRSDRRSRDVLVSEITNWLSGTTHVLMSAATGRSWTAMTVAQIDAAFLHVENYIDNDGVQTWYNIGVGIDLSIYGNPVTLNAGMANERLATAYASTDSGNRGYTDFFDVSGSGASRILTLRTPDYRWSLPSGFLAKTDWDPENPS